MDYNYKRFKPSNYDYTSFPGPKAGEKMLDFSLYTTAGKEVKLSDYLGKWVVIETASLTCPMFVKNISSIKKLIPKYPDVEFIVVYVREAHPGSRTGPHENMAVKRAMAEELHKAYGEVRPVLVDNVDGEMHQAYGSFPNMVYIVDPEGKVVYRCDWAFAHLIEQVLDDRPNINPAERKRILSAAPWIMIPVTLKGGWDALWDLVCGLPLIVWGHIKADFAELFRRKAA